MPLSRYNHVAALAAPNVTNLVTIKLASVEDYLTWCTQFQSLLLSHKLFGFVDGSIFPPNPFIYDASRTQQSNPLYRSWIKVDQSVRSWLFATLSREVLMDVLTAYFMLYLEFSTTSVHGGKSGEIYRIKETTDNYA